MRVLLVEDDPVQLLYFGEFISRCGHEVLKASTITRALEILETTWVDCAVVDWILPAASGFEIAEAACVK